MKGYGIFSLLTLIVVLICSLAFFGASIAGLWGAALMVVGASVAILAVGTLAGLTIRGLILTVQVLRDDRARLDASIKWTSRLLFVFASLSLVTALVLGFFAFGSCGPAFLAPYYHWLGLAGALLGYLLWFVLRHVVRASIGASAGKYAQRHRWPAPVFTLSSIAVFWGILWLVLWLLLSGRVDPADYPPRANSDYQLPYPSGTRAWVVQGNDTRLNHSGREQFAWDFRLSCGTPIVAARGGEVVSVTAGNSRSWGRGANNLIEIKHDDDTIGRYFHLQKNSAVVGPGDNVSQGQRLASVGSVGNSLTGHVHFEVTVSATDDDTMPISFSDVRRQAGVPRGFKGYKSANR